MKSLVLQPTEVAQWHALVNEAQAACQYSLDEVIESYLVFMLMRFCERPEMAHKIMAMEFLEAQGNDGRQPDRLRDVGDQCLLLSGLFPKLAEKRLVRVSYFVAIGRTAYDQLGSLVDRQSERLYRHLAETFVGVMDVLQAMRGLSGEPALTPLLAAELWGDTGSRVARQTLANCSEGAPVFTGGLSHNNSEH